MATSATQHQHLLHKTGTTAHKTSLTQPGAGELVLSSQWHDQGERQVWSWSRHSLQPDLWPAHPRVPAYTWTMTYKTTTTTSVCTFQRPPSWAEKEMHRPHQVPGFGLVGE